MIIESWWVWLVNIIEYYADVNIMPLRKCVFIGIYRNLSEFRRQIAEQLFGDHFRGVFGADSTNSSVFVAIYIKS